MKISKTIVLDAIVSQLTRKAKTTVRYKTIETRYNMDLKNI